VARRGERGFSLVEVILVVGIVALIAGLSAATLRQRPAQARTTALAFAELVAQARALAAVSATGTLAGGSGATIAVTRDASGSYIATLYAFRPAAGAAQQPVRDPRALPLRTATAIDIVTGGTRSGPPFALFFSASGAAGAAVPYTVGVDAPLAAQPVCPAQTGIVLAFDDGVHTHGYALSCAFAQLDVDTPVTLVP
jgi:prepilin-type N-terminal cleavage/methylation domain-containing protein